MMNPGHQQAQGGMPIMSGQGHQQMNAQQPPGPQQMWNVHPMMNSANQPVMMNQMSTANYQNNPGGQMNMNVMAQQNQPRPQSQPMMPLNRGVPPMSQQFMQQQHSQMQSQQSQLQQHQVRQQGGGQFAPGHQLMDQQQQALQREQFMAQQSHNQQMPQQQMMNQQQAYMPQQHYQQPSPQQYQQHSASSFNVPPGSVPTMHPHTPQQQQALQREQFMAQQSHNQQMPQQQMMNQQQAYMPQQHYQQPSPQQYQQHSASSFNVPPGSVPAMHPHTPQQQLGIPQRSVDGRFASPASVPQKSPATSVFSNQPSPQQAQPPSYGLPTSNTPATRPPPPNSQPTPPPSQVHHLPPFPTDPILANRELSVGSIRRALTDVSHKTEYLLSLKFCTDTRGPLQSVPTGQPFSIMNPGSANSPSVGVSTGPKDAKNLPTSEDVRLAHEKYVQAVTHFMVALDKFESNLATLSEAFREYSRYDSFANIKIPSDLQQRPYVDLLPPTLDAINDDRRAIESAIQEVNEMVHRVKLSESAGV